MVLPSPPHTCLCLGSRQEASPPGVQVLHVAQRQQRMAQEWAGWGGPHQRTGMHRVSRPLRLWKGRPLFLHLQPLRMWIGYLGMQEEMGEVGVAAGGREAPPRRSLQAAEQPSGRRKDSKRAGHCKARTRRLSRTGTNTVEVEVACLSSKPPHHCFSKGSSSSSSTDT